MATSREVLASGRLPGAGVFCACRLFAAHCSMCSSQAQMSHERLFIKVGEEQVGLCCPTSHGDR